MPTAARFSITMPDLTRSKVTTRNRCASLARTVVRWNTSLRGLACASFGKKDLSAIPNIFYDFGGTQSGMRDRSCAVAQKSDPGPRATKESRLRTRTRIALTSGIRQRGPLAFKGGRHPRRHQEKRTRAALTNTI